MCHCYWQQLCHRVKGYQCLRVVEGERQGGRHAAMAGTLTKSPTAVTHGKATKTTDFHTSLRRLYNSRLGSKSVIGELCHWSAAKVAQPVQRTANFTVARGQGRAASTASTGGAGTVVASYPM